MKNTGVLKAKKELIYSDSNRSGLNDPSAFSLSPPLSGIDFVDQGRSEAQSPQTLTIQKKSISSTAESRGGLTLNTPGDCHEREADHVADQIAQGFSSKVSVRKIGTPRIQKKSALSSNRSFAASRVSSSFEKKVKQSSKGGQPLSNAVRGPMEQSFGADLSGVRVHTDAAADGMNSSLKSHAFTTGQHIFFKQGKYAPKESSGKKLLAHELTHTQQQGASDRIAPWWPLGHVTLTTKIFNDDEMLSRAYNSKARKYLIRRSPDIDFVQDETNAMEKGIAQGKAKIDMFKSYIDQEKLDATLPGMKSYLLNRAAELWNNNELHYRPKWYMLHHGEGGYYKEAANVAKSKNKAMTDKLVAIAAGLYKSGQNEAGLSILSDAVHQAEDRGAHCEGEKFRGHDSRQSIRNEYILPILSRIDPAQRTDIASPWRTDHPQGKVADPDDASKNKRGAKVGLKYAQQALFDFFGHVNKNVKIPAIIALTNTEKKDSKPHQRHSKINTQKDKIGKITALSNDWGTKYPGHSGKKTIAEIKDWKEVGTKVDDMDNQGEMDTAASRIVYIKAWISSELVERIRSNKSGIFTNKLKTKRNTKIAKDQLEKMKVDYKVLFDMLLEDSDLTENELDGWLIDHAVKNYEYQRAERLSDEKKPDVIED